jgi:dCMP deaminase
MDDRQYRKDEEFMESAEVVGRRSKCGSRRIGTVIVQDGSVVSEGYSGSPRGSRLCQNAKICRRRERGFKSGEGLEHCPSVHSEQNAIIQAARNGICVRGATMYVECPPCKVCAGCIINSGIKRLVYPDMPQYDELSKVLLDESDVEVVVFS